MRDTANSVSRLRGLARFLITLGILVIIGMSAKINANAYNYSGFEDEDDITKLELEENVDNNFNYPAENFKMALEFTAKDNGLYDLNLKLPNGDYEITYFWSMREDMSVCSSTARNSVINNSETGINLLYAEPVVAGATLTVLLEFNANEAAEGVGTFHIQKTDNYSGCGLTLNESFDFSSDHYYTFTPEEDGKYYIDITPGDMNSFGRLNCYYLDAEGKVALNSGEFYSYQRSFIQPFEMKKGDTALIDLYDNCSDSLMEGTFVVKKWVDNAFTAVVTGTVEDTLKDIVVSPGDKVTLSVTASAKDTGKLKYQWSKVTNEYFGEEGKIDYTCWGTLNEEVINGAEGNTYNVTGTDDADAYNCLVYDNYGNFAIIYFYLYPIKNTYQVKFYSKEGGLIGRNGETNQTEFISYAPYGIGVVDWPKYERQGYSITGWKTPDSETELCYFDESNVSDNKYTYTRGFYPEADVTLEAVWLPNGEPITEPIPDVKPNPVATPPAVAPADPTPAPAPAATPATEVKKADSTVTVSIKNKATIKLSTKIKVKSKKKIKSVYINGKKLSVKTGKKNITLKLKAYKKLLKKKGKWNTLKIVDKSGKKKIIKFKTK